MTDLNTYRPSYINHYDPGRFLRVSWDVLVSSKELIEEFGLPRHTLHMIDQDSLFWRQGDNALLVIVDGGDGGVEAWILQRQVWPEDVEDEAAEG